METDEYSASVKTDGDYTDSTTTHETFLAVDGTCHPTDSTATDIARTETTDWSEISCWPQVLTDAERTFLVETGPVRNADIDFPVNDRGRHFTAYYYTRKLANGENVDRRWLVYSELCDKVFCFCCRLFGSGFNSFVKDGCCNWQNLSTLLREHETGTTHIRALCDWFEFERRLQQKQTIDKHVQKQIDADKLHWRAVLERLLTIVQFLAERNLAFRGSVEKLGDPTNGNFLGLVEVIGKFDVVLSEHLRRIKSDEMSDHYLGKTMQNQFIQLLADEVLQKICKRLTDAKYFSVILDCTPDVSHEEQLTVVLRCVEIVGDSVDVVEHFVGYLIVDDSSGESLAALLLRRLGELGLSITNCRGQGYDNGANMRGCNRGVQSRILQTESRAFFMPCGCHSLNLVLCDMAKSCTAAMTFFGVIQKIYVLFSASTQRWTILQKHTTGLSVKADCDTRWEAKVNSVKAVRYQIGQIYDALVEVADTTNDPKSRAEAMSLANTMKTFTFLVSLVIWYEILVQVNVTSKILQEKNIQLDVAITILHKTVRFLRDFRENGFEKSLVDARELAEELEMSPDEMIFANSSARRKRVRKQFDYEAQDESCNLNATDKFRAEFFFTVMDNAIASFTERFQQLTKFQDSFGFLFDIVSKRGTVALDDSALKAHSLKLEKVLSSQTQSDTNSSDVDGLGLFDELRTLRNIMPDTVGSLLDLLRYLHSSHLHEVFPNVSVALRVVLTIPVTVASGERSFSKLKLIKTYLRASMKQDRLNGLALLSIENAVASELDYSGMIEKFASLKARRVRI